VTDTHFGSLIVVSPEPFRCLVLCLLCGFKDILTQPLVANGAVIAFDVHVLLGLARLDVFKPDIALLDPSHQRITGKFRTLSARIVYG
jgi:hypothetical protein